MHAGETSATDLRVTARLRETEAMADETVLVVDDEVGMVTLLRNYLTREGYEIHTAPSGETALQFLEEHDCDVVLTDLRMGGMDGLALVRDIHATRPETPVILMTAFGGIDTAIEAVKAGRLSLCGQTRETARGRRPRAQGLDGTGPAPGKPRTPPGGRSAL